MTRSGQFWTNAEQVAFYRQVVHDNPQQAGEGSLAYMERIALLTGALKERLMLAPDAPLNRGHQERLPLAPPKRERVVGEDDDSEDVDDGLQAAMSRPKEG